MNQNLLPMLEHFRDLRVLVVGDIMLDVFLKGWTDRLCREAPVPVVSISEETDAPGGAGNTAANVASLGARVRLLGVVGDDPEGHRLVESLERAGVDTIGVIRARGYDTLTKTRVSAGNQILVRIDRGNMRALPPETAGRIELEASLQWADVCIVSDYDYGVVTDEIIERLRVARSSLQTPLIVDARDLTRFASLRPTAVKPNYEEVIRLLGPGGAMLRSAQDDLVQSLGERVLEVTGAQIAAVTLDREGALVFEPGHVPYRTYAQPLADSRATGAGDSFVAALALSLAAGADTPAAAEIASAAANVVVGKDGTCTCSTDELLDAITSGEKLPVDMAHFLNRLEERRRQGQKIVFTNGCFDIIHRGHISYLNTAKAQGDILIVGLNSDESVARLKGPERPINCLEDRLQILSALSCIDYLIPFEEDTPVRLIEAIRPDIFVKGGDYTRETLPEADLVERLGGRVQIVSYVDNHSTTSIIGRIRSLTAS